LSNFYVSGKLLCRILYECETVVSFHVVRLLDQCETFVRSHVV